MTRRRKLGITLMVIIAASAFYLLMRRSTADWRQVNLAFRGYTNSSAIISIHNAGPVPVVLRDFELEYADVAPPSPVVGLTNLVRWIPTGTNMVVPPSGRTDFLVRIPPEGQRWIVHLEFAPAGLRTRLGEYLIRRQERWARALPLLRRVPIYVVSQDFRDSPARAWAEIEKVHEAVRPPDQWRTNAPSAEQLAQFQKQVRETATTFADKAREFIQRFPSNEHIRDARITVVYVLGHAVAAGDTNAEKQIATFVSSVLADKTIAEDNRVGVLLYSAYGRVMKKAGMRLFTERIGKLDDEIELASIDSLHSALTEFPTNSMVFTMLLAIAERSKGERQKELATEIVNAPGAPPGVKTLASHVLKGTKPYEVGKPIDIRFTALDGREVDLAKLKGKVVLVEFWSTSCGPCIAGMPDVKALTKSCTSAGSKSWESH